VKTSPMLDISVAIKALDSVAQIHIVALQNEVKEVLWTLRKRHTKTPEIHTVNITKAGTQKFTFSWNSPAQINLSTPLKYLYEPNAAIMKSGAFNHMCDAFKLLKLHKHSHLYTSQDLVDFPGRRFKIEKVLPYSKKQMRHSIDFDKANISTRNFPETVAKLQEKWKLQQGGDRYLFFTTIENDKKIVLICSKIIDEV
ncbi:MAG: class I SAM-dependent methyltransferase, partial [Ulvibacter sp.]|nr:class I SAM-dependent methyltransferase [Ulvibacter sp.]